MISIRTFKHFFSTPKLTEKLQFTTSLQQRLQAWVQQEIVDDDPYDEETFFPESY